MRLLSKALLPLFVTSFCLGLNACTDDSKTSTPVVGGYRVVLSDYNFENFFNVSIEKEYDSDDSTNEYKYCVFIEAKNTFRIKVENDVNISLDIEFIYKLVVDTNTIYIVENSVDILMPHGRSRIKTPVYIATFDRPINEYPYFEISYTVTAATGSLFISND